LAVAVVVEDVVAGAAAVVGFAAVAVSVDVDVDEVDVVVPVEAVVVDRTGKSKTSGGFNWFGSYAKLHVDAFTYVVRPSVVTP
jgi:hypothetical protein